MACTSTCSDGLSGQPGAASHRQLAITNGCTINDLTRDHVLAIDGLVTNWHGQGPLNLPGAVNVERRHDRLTFYQN